MFDGEVSSTRGKSRNGQWYPLLSVAVSAGLFHPNCRHTLSTWMEGVSTKPKPLDADVVRRNAKLEQQKRRLENLVRKTKRLAEGTADQEQAKVYRRQARAAQAQLRQFVQQNGDVLRRDYWREQTHGVPADVKEVAKPEERGILVEGEVAAITSYISGGSYSLNAKLREGIPLEPHEEKMASALDQALLKMPIFDGTVYRSLSDFEIEDVDEFVRQYRPGDKVLFCSFLSTSDRVYDGYFPIQYVIQSRSGRDIRQYNPEESEILYPRGSSFRVTQIIGRTIYLEEDR